MDKEVIGLNGWVIGTIKDVVFDEKNWKIGFLDVELDPEIAKEYDMKKLFRATHIPLDVDQVQGIGDKVTLKTSKEDLMIRIRGWKLFPETHRDFFKKLGLPSNYFTARRFARDFMKNLVLARVKTYAGISPIRINHLPRLESASGRILPIV